MTGDSQIKRASGAIPAVCPFLSGTITNIRSSLPEHPQRPGAPWTVVGLVVRTHYRYVDMVEPRITRMPRMNERAENITRVIGVIHGFINRSRNKLRHWKLRTALPLMLALITVVFLTSGTVTAAVSAPGLPRIVTLSCPYAIGNMILHTRGNKLLNLHNKLVVLHGVDLPSLEWTNRGDHIRRSMRAAITQWHCQIIRIPTAVNRWFGQAPGQRHGGRVYRHIVDQLIRIAARHRVYVVLDLHWNDMDRNFTDLGQHRMPDHSCVLYWRSAARRYRNYPNVFYDLYNEPHGISWITWRNGGICTGETKTTVVTYRAVGMQRLYDVVRHAGAPNVVIIGGISWAYDEFGVTHGYAIVGKNIMYDCHVYPWKQHWKHNFVLAAKNVPLIFDEFGGTRKELAFGRKVIAFAAVHHISWCAWALFPAMHGPVLIKNWNYQPTAFGELIKKALTMTNGH